MENTHARKGEVSYIKLQVITVLKESWTIYCSLTKKFTFY
jgi:hypothetical protein